MPEAADDHSELTENARNMFKILPGVKLPTPLDAGKARPILMKVVERAFPLFSLKCASVRPGMNHLLSPFI